MNERLNIRRMNTPESGAKIVPFDIARDITRDDWKDMQGMAEHDRREKDWEKFANIASRLKTLDARQTPSISEDEWQQIEAKLASLTLDGLIWQMELDFCASMKTLRPESVDFFTQLASWNKEEEKRTKMALRGESDGSWYEVAFLKSYLRRMYPDISQPVDDLHWQHMCEALRDLREEKQYNLTYQMVACMRILRPGADAVATPEEWKEVNRLLTRHRGDIGMGSSTLFAYIAERAKILAAEDIRFSAAGMELIMPKLKPEGTAPLPDALAI